MFVGVLLYLKVLYVCCMCFVTIYMEYMHHGFVTCIHAYTQSHQTTHTHTQLLLGLVIAPPILAGFVYLLQTTGKFVALYVWAFVLVISLVFMTIYPTVIAPLFNKFDPLPEGELR